ncbi:MAG TPA: 3-hydroxyacyl-CoA dehydrogenase NAD-binding domain-containing protein [Bacteroidota bacterium]|nr:3-hydroxyacyl-CoA dehydrogenase NAD-binding domain-containing protein [Bacteroidota bacterium]
MTTTVGIIGAGTMGGGIAQVAAGSGCDVLLHDAAGGALEQAMQRIEAGLGERARKTGTGSAEEALRRIRPCAAISDLAGADVVIEAAFEDLEVKREIFRALEAVVNSGAVLATNTSSLSVTAIGALTRTPGSVIGMHFFNPAPRMKLVEIVPGSRTSDETVARARSLALAMGKTPILCADTPGFIVNRVARPFYGEALRLLGEGKASAEEIDRIVRLEGGFRMGPFELMDLIGIDVNYAVTRSVYERFFHEPRFRPHPIQARMVEAGTLGRKTGRGFYTYG